MTVGPRARAAPDPAAANLWHAMQAIEEIPPAGAGGFLLGERVGWRLGPGGPEAWRDGGNAPEPLPARLAYGYLWTSLGDPEPLFDVPEYAEPDRRNIHAATVGVRVSAPRAIENFLDMGHFPFVHTGILGDEPYTEVKEYKVDERDGELVATECRFYQPKAAATSSEGADVEYVYRVPHPYCSVLYKSSGQDPSRMDVIALFALPETEERVRAHMLLSLLDDANRDADIRDFQIRIFGQDKPILENQRPRRLPLDPRAETPIRADRSSIAYRRWLADRGVRFGVIPAAGGADPC